ncbi:HXXEE domain-containing protein [Paenibacillus humicus]|uniref:HXXEE domain-containing protein n=1 Tax=Paenibacillus humicus TaxID=412861 RepID=UPI003D28C4D2
MLIESLTSLNEQIHFLSLLWLFPIIFMFHDFEEILTIERWVTQHGARIQSSLPPFARKLYQASFQMNTLNFAKDVLAVFIVIVTVTVLAVFYSFYLPFIAALHLFFLHVFTHVFQSVYFRLYAPGVLTSIVLVLPYSLYTYYRLLTDHIVGPRDLLWGLILLLVVLPPALLLLLQGRKRYVTNTQTKL